MFELGMKLKADTLGASVAGALLKEPGLSGSVITASGMCVCATDLRGSPEEADFF